MSVGSVRRREYNSAGELVEQVRLNRVDAMPEKKRRLQFGLRSFFVFVTVAAMAAWYLRPTPTPAEIVERIKTATPNQIPGLLRQVKHLSGSEIQYELFGKLGRPNANHDCRREYFLSQPELKNLYLGSKAWAEKDPMQVRAWIDRELHEKDVSGLDMVDSGILSVLTGFTEGMATQGLQKGFSVADGFTWRNDHYDAVICGLYPEIEKRPIQESMDWVDTFTEYSFYTTSILEAVQKRVIREDVDTFVKWTESRILEDDSDWHYDMRTPQYALHHLVDFDLERAIEWIDELETRRSGHVAREIIGCYGGAYVSVADEWCEQRGRREFIDWAMEKLRRNPTDELYMSWHHAIAETAYNWPEDEGVEYVEKAVFMLDGGAVNFPGICWYLYQLPDERVLELSKEWLGNESVANEAQKNEMRKAFGHAMIWIDKDMARTTLSKLHDQEQRRMFLAGVDNQGAAGTGWWIRWRHDIGVLKNNTWTEEDGTGWELPGMKGLAK